MRVLFCFFLFLINKHSYAQEDTLIRHALSDLSNFEIMSWLNETHKMPDKFYVFDTTLAWNINRFYLKGFGNSIDKKPKDEHHPYNHSYIFKDSSLNSLFPLKEKLELLKKSSTVDKERININTSIALSISSYKFIDSGFILWVSKPVYSSDGNFAFIDFTVLEKGSTDTLINEAYHSTICIVYKLINKKWERIKIINHIIL